MNSFNKNMAPIRLEQIDEVRKGVLLAHNQHPTEKDDRLDLLYRTPAGYVHIFLSEWQHESDRIERIDAKTAQKWYGVLRPERPFHEHNCRHHKRQLAFRLSQGAPLTSADVQAARQAVRNGCTLVSTKILAGVGRLHRQESLALLWPEWAEQAERELK